MSGACPDDFLSLGFNSSLIELFDAMNGWLLLEEQELIVMRKGAWTKIEWERGKATLVPIHKINNRKA